MFTTSDFKNGLIINHKNNLWKIIEFLHVKPGKGNAFVRSKLKNIRTGQVVDETFRAGEKIVLVRVEARDYTYLYNENENYVFMDQETYDQINLSKSQDENVLEFLIENTEATIAFNGEEAIEVEIRSEKAVAKGSCDAGTSTGSHEVNAYPKEGVDFIVDKFNKNISKQIVNLDISDFEDLEEVEKVFEIFDVTKDLKNIGGNIIIATEYAILKAVSKGEVWKFLNPKAKKVPGILANIVEGGKHIHGRGADFQEFLIVLIYQLMIGDHLVK